MNKRVVLFFASYRGGRSMSRIYNGLIRKREQFLLYSTHELRMASAGKVCASDASLEKHVAAIQDSAITVIEHYAAGAMSGNVEYFKLSAADFYHIALGKKPLHFGDMDLLLYAEHLGLLLDAFHKRLIELMG